MTNETQTGDFCLSDKILLYYKDRKLAKPLIREEDVKEFVRRLKEDLNPLDSDKEDLTLLTFKEQIKIIDKLAGEKLSK